MRVRADVEGTCKCLYLVKCIDLGHILYWRVLENPPDFDCTSSDPTTDNA